jgi:hypothetical protein
MRKMMRRVNLRVSRCQLYLPMLHLTIYSAEDQAGQAWSQERYSSDKTDEDNEETKAVIAVYTRIVHCGNTTYDLSFLSVSGGVHLHHVLFRNIQCGVLVSAFTQEGVNLRFQFHVYRW